MPGTLRAVVDTNLFHECLKLDAPDFPWSDIGDFDEIELIVTGPVQGELDGHKKDTRSHIKKRAIIAVAWFRDMLVRNQSHMVLREASPRVTMRLDAIPRGADHEGVLDYSEPDDRIVGIATALATARPQDDIRLVSDDTRPAMKAKALGLPFLFFPHSWRRREEEDDQQKEIKQLRNQLEAVQRSGPILRVQAEGYSHDRAVVLRRVAFLVPTAPQLQALESQLREHMPLSRLSRSASAPKRPGFGFRGLEHELVYIPPDDAAMARFRDVTYPGWLNRCMGRLQTLSSDLNRQIPSEILTINLFNEGSRPADQLRVTFIARGPFLIAPSVAGERAEPEVASLSKPPSPPMGYWQRRGESVAQALVVSPLIPGLDPYVGLGLGRGSFQKDDHLFYYDPERPGEPVQEFSLTCRSFRHGSGPELFEIDLFSQIDGPLMSGSVVVRVYASNVSPIVEKVIPVKIATEEADIGLRAGRLINSIQVRQDLEFDN